MAFYFYDSTFSLLDTKIKQLVLFQIILCICQSFPHEKWDFFIVWDVGQGSWSTAVSKDQCLHFDMGGQYFRNSKRLFSLCKNKKNILALTHLDKDHVRFINKYKNILNLCLFKKKLFPNISKNYKLNNCLYSPSNMHLLRQAVFRTRNDSHVYIWGRKVLITGDLPKKQELMLIENLKHNSVRILLVGHHGSKTSSHKRLISALPMLQQAIVSANSKVYGHPHPTTSDTFAQKKIALLLTEDFGTLLYEQ